MSTTSQDLNTLFLEAIKKDENEAIRLLAQNPDLATINIEETPALIMSVCKRRWKLFQELIKYQKNIDIIAEQGTYKGITALWLAAAFQEWNLVEQLVTLGARSFDAAPVEGPYKGTTTLGFAANWQQWGLAEQMIKLGARGFDVTPAEGVNKGKTALWYAVYDKLDVAELMIKLGARSFDVSPAEGPHKGKTALWCAVGYRKSDLAEQMIKLGANVTVTDENGNTPLHLAAHDGYSNLFRPLLEACADINAQNKDGDTPLLTAISNRNSKARAAKELIGLGADVKIPDKNGNTPLHWAVEKNLNDLLPVLLEKGANIDAQNNLGTTPLLCSIIKGDSKTSKELIALGANVKISDKNESTALHWAAQKGLDDLFPFFLQQGMDPNAENLMKRTPFFYAVMGANPKAILALMAEGTQVKTEDNEKDTPLHLAASRNLTSFIPLFIQRGIYYGCLNKKGYTAAQISFQYEYTDAFKLLEMWPLIGPIFTSGHMQAIANRVIQAYLEAPRSSETVMPEEYFLKNRTLLGTLLKKELEEALKTLFEFYKIHLKEVSKVLSQSKIGQVKRAFLSRIIEAHLLDCYLSKSLITTLKPYIGNDLWDMETNHQPETKEVKETKENKIIGDARQFLNLASPIKSIINIIRFTSDVDVQGFSTDPNNPYYFKQVHKQEALLERKYRTLLEQNGIGKNIAQEDSGSSNKTQKRKKQDLDRNETKETNQTESDNISNNDIFKNMDMSQIVSFSSSSALSSSASSIALAASAASTQNASEANPNKNSPRGAINSF